MKIFLVALEALGRRPLAILLAGLAALSVLGTSVGYIIHGRQVENPTKEWTSALHSTTAVWEDDVKIKDMLIGEIFWTVPWGAWMGSGPKDMFLMPEYTIHQAPGGTVTMLIQRCSQGEWAILDVVEPYSIDDVWAPNENPNYISPPFTPLRAHIGSCDEPSR